MPVCNYGIAAYQGCNFPFNETTTLNFGSEIDDAFLLFHHEDFEYYIDPSREHGMYYLIMNCKFQQDADILHKIGFIIVQKD